MNEWFNESKILTSVSNLGVICMFMFCPIEMFDFHSSQTGVTSRLYTMYPEMKQLSKYFYSCSCSSVKQALLGSGTVRAKMYLSGCFFDWHPPTSSWHYLWESFSFCRLSLGWFNHINLNSFYSIFWIKFWIDISDWILNE